MSTASPQQRVLDALQDGVLTWDALKYVIQVNDESLGFVLGELLNQRKIWTAQRNDTIVYGIERRTGLVPRFTHPQRRSTD